MGPVRCFFWFKSALSTPSGRFLFFPGGGMDGFLSFFRPSISINLHMFFCAVNVFNNWLWRSRSLNLCVKAKSPLFVTHRGALEYCWFREIVGYYFSIPTGAFWSVRTKHVAFAILVPSLVLSLFYPYIFLTTRPREGSSVSFFCMFWFCSLPFFWVV